MTFVVDASISLAWCFEAEQTPKIMEVLERVIENGAVVPQLWPIEALNGLLASQRRRRIDVAMRHQLASFLRALPLRVDDETYLRVWTATNQLADQHGLTVYDATYLELALRLGLPLATSDKALIEAAERVGVPIV